MADLCQRIADWAAQHRVDARHAAHVRLLVRDFAACVVAGSERVELAPALCLARPGPVVVWGRREKFDMTSAALIYGAAGSLLQLHDLYLPALLHPSCTVIAAACAARMPATSAAQFIHAVAVGYELCHRLGDAYRASGAVASIATATAGAFGAAVSAALVQGRDAEFVARALSLTPLLMPVPPVAAVRCHAEAIALHGALAARAGVEAMLLAEHTGAVAKVLEGDAVTPGYGAVLGTRPLQLHPEQWDGSTLDAVIGKRWPACFGAYGALEAVLNMATPAPDTITKVRIGLPKRLLSIVECGPHAGGLYDRLMSVRWVVARALQRGPLQWHDVEPDASTDQLAARIELQHAAHLDELPSHMLAADVEIVAMQTRMQQWRRDLAKGSSADTPMHCSTMNLDEPHSWQQKYLALTAHASNLGLSMGLFDELLEE